MGGEGGGMKKWVLVMWTTSVVHGECRDLKGGFVLEMSTGGKGGSMAICARA